MPEAEGGSLRRNPVIVAAVIGVAGAIAAAVIANPPPWGGDDVGAFQQELGEFCERAPQLPSIREFSELDVDTVPVDRAGYADAMAAFRSELQDELATLPEPPGELEADAEAERAGRTRFMTALGRHIRFVRQSPPDAVTEPPSGAFARRENALDREAVRWLRSFDRLSGGRCV